MHVILPSWIYQQPLSNSLSVPSAGPIGAFSTRTWLHHNETFKIGSASMAKIVPKCIKIVSTDVRKYKILSGEIPRAPLMGGVMPPLVLSPFGTHKTSLTFMAGPLFKSRRRPWVGVPNTWNILLNQLTGQVPLIGVPNTCTWNILLNQLTAGQVALVGVPNTWNILLNQL